MRVQEEEALRAGAEYEAIRPVYVEFGTAVRSLISQLCQDEEIDTDSITFRIKKTSSLVQKLQREERYTSLADLTDKIGVRIVTRYVSDVEQVSKVLASEFNLIEDVRHGGESVEAFGYASRHLILGMSDNRKGLREWRNFADLVVEVQIRSILQHAWASISHGLDYKSTADVPKDLRRQLFRVAALLETGDELFDDFRAQSVKLIYDYRQDVARDDWRQLPVDVESIRAAADKIGLEDLTRAAIKQGVKPSTSENNTDERYVSRVVAAAAAAGVRTLGEIADISAAATADADWLRRMARQLTWYANPLDVITLRIVSEHPSRSVERSISTGDWRIREDLVKRALAEKPSAHG